MLVYRVFVPSVSISERNASADFGAVNQKINFICLPVRKCVHLRITEKKTRKSMLNSFNHLL
jgi:hypothetical protein